MFSFIIYVLIALIFGYFATQNTGPVTLTFESYKLEKVPLYIVLGITLLIGLLFSWLIELINSFSSAMKIHGKEMAIKEDKKIIRELTKKINQLEIENARLSGQIKSETKDPDSI